MPRLQRFGAVTVRMYADDQHPPRSNILAPDFQVLERISDFAVIVWDARPTQIDEVLTWAQDHREMLALKWAELNKRG